jgi:hypothetical protein
MMKAQTTHQSKSLDENTSPMKVKLRTTFISTDGVPDSRCRFQAMRSWPSNSAVTSNSAAMATEVQNPSFKEHLTGPERPVGLQAMRTFNPFESYCDLFLPLPPGLEERSREQKADRLESGPVSEAALSSNPVAHVLKAQATHQIELLADNSTQVEGALAATVHQACANSFSHSAQDLKDICGESFLDMGRRAEAWIEAHYSGYEKGRVIIDQLRDETKPNEELYYAALLSFKARAHGVGTANDKKAVPARPPGKFNPVVRSLQSERVQQLKAQHAKEEDKGVKRRMALIIDLMESSVYRDNQDCDKKNRPRTPDPFDPPTGKLGGTKRPWENLAAAWKAKWREIDGVRKLKEVGFPENASLQAWRAARCKLDRRLKHDQDKQLEEARKTLAQ